MNQRKRFLQQQQKLLSSRRKMPVKLKEAQQSDILFNPEKPPYTCGKISRKTKIKNKEERLYV